MTLDRSKKENSENIYINNNRKNNKEKKTQKINKFVHIVIKVSKRAIIEI